MNKIVSVYSDTSDVFEFENFNKKQIKNHISWNNNFLKTIKAKCNDSKQNIEITSKDSQLIGYKQNSNNGSSTPLKKAELEELRNLLFETNYILEKDSLLQQLLLQKLATSKFTDNAHIIFSSKDCIVGIRIFITNTLIESMLPLLRETILSETY